MIWDKPKEEENPKMVFNPPKIKCACGKDALDGNIQCHACLHRK